MEILKLIFAFLAYTVLVATLTGVFLYCVAYLNAEEVDPDDENF